jgi:hypothetical protein
LALGIVNNVPLSSVEGSSLWSPGTVKKVEIEVEGNQSNIVITTRTLVSDVPNARGWENLIHIERVVVEGSFAYANDGSLVDGIVVSIKDQFANQNSNTGGFQWSNIYERKVSSAASWADVNNPSSAFWSTSSYSSLGFSADSSYFREEWYKDPFAPMLLAGASTGSGSSSGGGSSSTPQTLTTTTSVDTLTGIKKSKDIFKFDADPSGQVDKVTGFNAKEKDILSISKSAFEIDRGTFAIAKNAKALAKQLATNVDIVYNRQTGELILNANGVEPGFGDDGGVFAVLMGRPTVGAGSVEFY